MNTSTRTPGSTRRRNKAIARRSWVTNLTDLWDYRLGRIPADATSVMICSCGTRMWLRDGATAEDREAFDLDVSAHDYCDDDFGGAA